jgi:hypothetical protein
MIARISRDMAIACVAIAILFLLWKRNVAAPLGVLGGGLLIGMSFWAIRGTVDAMVALRTGGETGRISTLFTLVKFFTRHAIVALAAYVMMVRLHLEPVGMLAGVSSLGIAVAI